MRSKVVPILCITLNFLMLLILSQFAVGTASSANSSALSGTKHLPEDNKSYSVIGEITTSSGINLVDVGMMGVIDDSSQSFIEMQLRNAWRWINPLRDSNYDRLASSDQLNVNAPSGTSFVVEYESPANPIRLYDAVQTLDGGFIAVGEISTSTYKKAWIVKTNEFGEIQWQKSYSLSRDGSAKSVHLKGSGYIVAGEYYYSGDGYHITVTNLDQYGNVIWSKRIIRKTENSTFSIEPTHDGGHIIAVERYLFNFPPITTLVKIDSLGEVVWAKDPPATYIKQAVQLNQGGYAAVGTYGNDIWVASLDERGNVIWQKTYSYPNDRPSWGDVISATADGGMIIGSGVSLGSTFYVSMIVKLDINGHVEWTKYILPGGFDLSDIEQTADGYFLTGYVLTLNSRDVWLIKLSLSGDELWQRLYGRDSHSEMGMSVNATTDGGALIAGNISDTTTRGLLLKTDSGGNLVGCNIQEEDGFSLGTALVAENTLTGGYYTAYPVYSEVYANDTGYANAIEYLFCSDCNDTDDSDHDGLLRGWEICGYYHNRPVGFGDPDVDLPAMGADPNYRDIFVEIDYMIDPGYCIPSLGVCIRGHSYRPDPEAIDMVVDRFRERGIHLHVDFGDDAPLVYSDDYDTWGDLPHGSGASEIPYERLLVPDNATFNFERYLHLKLNYFSSSRWDVFHYVLFTHFLGGNLYTQTDMRINFTPGIVRALFGSDMVVGLGDNPSVMYQAVTFMHELGHNLGLCHGGPYLLNVNQVTGELGECASEYDYKPNYLSIMSYMYGTRGGLTFLGDGRVDYSGEFQVTSPLDENLLIEANGLGNQLDHYTIRWYCDLGPSIPVSNWQLTLDNTPDKIDWDCNEAIANTSISINRNLQRNEQLHSFDDWSNLKLDVGCIGTRQRCIGRGLDASTTYSSPFGIPTPPALPSIEDSPLESTPIDYGISFASDSFFVVEPNVSSSFPITLTNTGKLTATVTISQTHVASWYNLSTLPTQIVLSPNEVVSYEIFINVPTNVTTGDLQEIALTAFLHESPSLSDSSKTLAQIGPYAWFTANTTTGHIPLTVEFEDLSVGNITSRYWEFGDGFVSAQQNPTHIYTTTGEYTVVLTVTGPNGSHTFTQVNLVRVLPREIFLPIVLRP